MKQKQIIQGNKVVGEWNEVARSYILRGATHFRIATDIVSRSSKGSGTHVTPHVTIARGAPPLAVARKSTAHLSEKRQKIATIGITKIAIQNKLLIDQSVIISLKSKLCVMSTIFFDVGPKGNKDNWLEDKAQENTKFNLIGGGLSTTER